MPRWALTGLVAACFALSCAFADETAERVLDPSVCATSAAGPWTADRLERAVVAANSAECLAMMEAFPQPQLTRINRDRFTLQRYSFWRVKAGGAKLYATPGSQAIGMIPRGFNFVQAINTSVEGWIQERGGRWLRAEDAKQVHASSFRGMLLPDDWTRPFAIILDKTGTYASTRPGEAGNPDSGFITRRYKLVNIFARAEDSAGKVWYLVGPRQWIRQELVAKFAPARRPEAVAGRWVAVDLFEQTLIAYEDEKPVFATVISSGMALTQTDEGVFTVWARLTNDSMSGLAGERGAYALQFVPWVMYFNGGESLHGAYWHDSFGYRRSRGCVNLSVSDARWVYEWMGEAEPKADGEIVNHVYVFSTGEYDLT